MIDAITALRNLLYREWTETNPAKTDIKWQKKKHYDENDPSPQIWIDELVPSRIDMRNMCRGKYWVKHGLVIRVYLRHNLSYSDDNFETLETTFRNMMKEINHILAQEMREADNIYRVDMTSWEEVTDRDAEPIVFLSQQIVTCYYGVKDDLFEHDEFDFKFMYGDYEEPCIILE